MDFVNGKDDIPYMKWKIKFMFQTTKQMRIENLDFVWITYLTCFTALGKCPNCFTSLKYGGYVISNKYVFSLVFCETNKPWDIKTKPSPAVGRLVNLLHCAL